MEPPLIEIEMYSALDRKVCEVKQLYLRGFDDYRDELWKTLDGLTARETLAVVTNSVVDTACSHLLNAISDFDSGLMEEFADVASGLLRSRMLSVAAVIRTP